MIDVTTLSDGVRKYIPGIQDLSSFSFNCNYIPADYQKINAMAGTEYAFSIWVGATTSNNENVPDGSNGKWDFSGQITCFKAGGDVNAAQDMTVVLFPTTDFKFTLPA